MAYSLCQKETIRMKRNELSATEEKIYKNLKSQVDSFFNKTNEKSFKTRERYADGMNDFAKFLAKEYHKEKMTSVNNKHIQAYVYHMQKDPKRYSTSYTTTNMSSIRFFYSRSIGDKFRIKTNKDFGVKPRTQSERIGQDRSMKNDEINKPNIVEFTSNPGTKAYFPT